MPLYRHWNAKINVISRKDIEYLYLHHVLHSLSIARFFSFPPDSRILDIGTGGGFPGIPLAILFPHCRFILCDSIGKKIKVADAVVSALKLQNVQTVVSRAEAMGNSCCDYVVSRAVTRMDTLVSWARPCLSRKVFPQAPPSGILYLKGGDLRQEIAQASLSCRIPPDRFTVWNIKSRFSHPFFEEKKIIYLVP